VRALLVVPLALGGLAAFAATRTPVSDSDFFWHLAIGRDIAAHGVPRVDVYSWTVAGNPVLPDQWLGELLMYAAYAIGSWSGTIALRAFAVGALICIVVWTALSERPRRPSVAVLASLPAIGVSRFAWTDRPELFGLVCFAILVALLRAVRRGSLRAFALCVPLVLVWTNLHGSFALGLGLVLDTETGCGHGVQPLVADGLAAGLHARLDEHLAVRLERHLPGVDRSDVLDDADELMAHPAASRVLRQRLVGPEVAAADRGPGDDHQGISRLDQVSIRDRLDPVPYTNLTLPTIYPV